MGRCINRTDILLIYCKTYVFFLLLLLLVDVAVVVNFFVLMLKRMLI